MLPGRSSASWASLATLDHVDLGPPARGTGDEVEPLALAQAERLEQLAPGPRLLHRIGGQRVADGVADALAEQRGQAGGGLHQAGRRRTGLGDPQVQRVVDRVGQLAVGLDHDGHVRGLDRDLHVVEVDLAEVVQLALSRFDHGLGGDGAAVLGVELLVERAAVHPDADGHASVLALAGHGLDVLGVGDVARVEPQARHAGVEGLERPAVLVVDVGDDRHRRAGHDLGQALGRLTLVAGAAHDVGSGAGQRVDLGQRAVDVGGLGGGHGLHGDGRVAADGDIAHHDLARPASGIAHRHEVTPGAAGPVIDPTAGGPGGRCPGSWC